MIKRLKALIDDEGGNSIIEATFIVTLTVIFIFIVMLLGFVYYQNILLQSVANQTAVSIARTYTYKNKDPVTGYIHSANLHDLGFIESSYLLFGSDKNAAEAAEMKRLAKKLEENNRLISYSGNAFIVDDKTKVQSSGAVLLQNEVVVVLEAKYSVPLVGFFGVNDGGKTVIRASGRAICADMLGMHNIDRALDAVAKTLGSAAPLQIVQKVTKCVENIFNASGNLVDWILHKPEYETDTSNGDSGNSGSGETAYGGGSNAGGSSGSGNSGGGVTAYGGGSNAGGSSGSGNSGGGGTAYGVGSNAGGNSGGGFRSDDTNGASDGTSGRAYESGGTSAGGNAGGGFR